MKYCVGLIVLLVGLYSCGKTPEEFKIERIRLAEEGNGDIVVGVVWTSEDSTFVRGVELAAEEINYENGVLAGRKIKLEKRVLAESSASSIEDQNSLHNTRKIAQSLSMQTDLIAVIGHRATSYAIPASIVYEDHGVLFFPPAATGLMFTRHNFKYVFRAIPNNRKMANYIAQHCYQMGYRSMAIFNNRSTYGEELSDSFVEGAVSNKIDIVHRRSFFETRTDFSELIAELRKKPHIDAIFLATGATDGARFINQSRKMGVDVPIMGGEALGTERFIEQVGKSGEGIIIPTVFNEKAPYSVSFVQKFQEKYHKAPDQLAAAGYDALQLLAFAIGSTESAVPSRIATFLRYMPSWQGVSGNFEFEETGELEEKRLYLKLFCQEQFHTLPPKTFELIHKETSAVTLEKVRQCLDLFKELVLSDQDQDGIADKLDICPDSIPEEITKGVYSSGEKMGCPFDKDRDGVPDYRDECLDTPESGRDRVDEKGCPQDLDKDGIPDTEDICSETLLNVVVDNQGCPLITETPEVVTLVVDDLFVKGTDQLQPKKAKVKLDELVERLTQTLSYVSAIEITGHTDSMGNKLKNKELSQKRAEQVSNYLISQKLPADKITTSGQGDENPIDTNDTELGRAQNRRIEIKIIMLQTKPVLPPPTSK